MIQNDSDAPPRDASGIPSAYDDLNEEKDGVVVIARQRANAALSGPQSLSARQDLLASTVAIILQQRVLLGACALFGLVATYEATHGSADYAVMASIMANNASNDRAL